MLKTKNLFLVLLILPLTWIAHNVSANTTSKFHYFHTNGSLLLNKNNQSIVVDNKFILSYNDSIYKADQATILYSSLNHFNFENVEHINAVGHIYVKMLASNRLLTGDRYVYDKSQQVHVITANKNSKVQFDSPEYYLTAHDRAEYFIAKNIIVLRGDPHIEKKPTPIDQKGYQLNSNLINIKLTNNNQSIKERKELDFAEAVGNVMFSDSSSHITSDYAIYYKDDNLIYFQGNVSLISPKGHLEACQIRYNVTTQEGELVPCQDNTSKITGTIKP